MKKDTKVKVIVAPNFVDQKIVGRVGKVLGKTKNTGNIVVEFDGQVMSMPEKFLEVIEEPTEQRG